MSPLMWNCKNCYNKPCPKGYSGDSEMQSCNLHKKYPNSYPETHQNGMIEINSDFKQQTIIGDFGIQIAEDGRVWICINGVAFIRFKPLTSKQIERIQNFKITNNGE